MGYTLFQFETYHRLAIDRKRERMLWQLQLGALLERYAAGDDKAAKTLKQLAGDLTKKMH